MKKNARPIVFASKCLTFAACRWNGAVIPNSFIEKMKSYADFITACPEIEIGLGVPRNPIRMVYKNKVYSLVQLNTGKDVTEKMRFFTSKFLDSFDEIDGFILKDRSPSCGLEDVKVYMEGRKREVTTKTTGFFAKGVLDKFHHLAVETESRLAKHDIRKHFLTKLFTFAAFRKVKKNPSMKGLVDFHTKNKFLLMTYSRNSLEMMNAIVANHQKKPLGKVFEKYEKHLGKVFAKMPKYILGFKKQSFFELYPAELMAVKDSGKGKNP